MSGIYGRARKAPLLSLVHGMAGMKRGLDFAKAEAALKRAAKLGDGWHGLRLSPESARSAIATMDEIGHRENFAVSLRLQTRVGGIVDGIEPGAVLQGDAGAIIEQVNRYADAGIHHLVIEPLSSDLQDFLQQLDRFAEEVAREFAETP